METPLKFRIMVIERNDGARMFHPQVLMPVDIKVKKNWWQNVIGSEFVYDWRGFRNYRGELVPCLKGEHGNGGSDTKYAYEEIEQFKLDAAKRGERLRAEELESRNKETKSITYLEW